MLETAAESAARTLRRSRTEGRLSTESGFVFRSSSLNFDKTEVTLD